MIGPKLVLVSTWVRPGLDGEPYAAWAYARVFQGQSLGCVEVRPHDGWEESVNAHFRRFLREYSDGDHIVVGVGGVAGRKWRPTQLVVWNTRGWYVHEGLDCPACPNELDAWWHRMHVCPPQGRSPMGCRMERHTLVMFLLHLGAYKEVALEVDTSGTGLPDPVILVDGQVAVRARLDNRAAYSRALAAMAEIMALSRDRVIRAMRGPAPQLPDSVVAICR